MRGIDHVIVGTADLDAAAAGFARLGFNVSPKMVHPFGTANRLIMFGDSFIELLGIEDASRLGRLVVLRGFLRATGGGPWGLVFRALDARAEWRRCGLCQPSSHWKSAIRASAWLRNRRRLITARSSMAKSLSAMALAYASPVEPMEDITPAAQHRLPEV